MRYFDLEPVVKVPFFDPAKKAGTRQRRIYRGKTNADRVPEFQPDMAYAWLPAFEKYKLQHQEQCEAVFVQFEARVNEYGYSLRHPMLVSATDKTRPYLLNIDT